MAIKASEQIPVVIGISAALRKRFREQAAGALARRSSAWLHGQFLSMTQWFVIGCAGLLGLYVWSWSPIGLLILFLAGLFSGLLADAIQWMLYRRHLQRVWDDLNNDRVIWAMVAAARRRRSDIPVSAMKYVDPGMAVMVDLYAGGFAAILFYLGLRHLGVDLLAAMQAETGIRWALIAVVILPWAALLETIVRRTRGTGEVGEGSGIQSGGRGGGLLLVVIAFLFLAEPNQYRPDSSIHSLMVFINGGTIVVAALAALGLVIMTKERRWLAEHLAQVQAGEIDFGPGESSSEHRSFDDDGRKPRRGRGKPRR